MLKASVLRLFVLFCTAMSFTSCNSGDDSSAEPATTPSFTAVIDGTPYAATTATAAQNDGILTITGARGDNGEKITIRVLAGSLGTHSGDMAYINESGEQFINTDPGTITHGTVTISSSGNNTISGTFEFTGFSILTGQPVEVMSGTFQNITVTVPEAPVNTGTIAALINGTENNFVEAYVARADTNFILTGTNLGTMQILQITMPADIAPGTYTISNDPTAGIFALIDGEAGTVNSIQGTLVITANSDGTLSGTFSFEGQDSGGNPVQVTGGTFTAQVQE